MSPLNQIFPENSGHSHDWRGIILASMALIVYWLGSFNLILDSKTGSAEVLGLEEMISRTGIVSDCGVDPGRAVFELAPIDLNRADAEVLASLRGIGPELAGRIIAYRDKQGGFAKVSDILKVKGIGQRKLVGVKKELTVSDCGI